MFNVGTRGAGQYEPGPKQKDRGIFASTIMLSVS